MDFEAINEQMKIERGIGMPIAYDEANSLMDIKTDEDARHALRVLFSLRRQRQALEALKAADLAPYKDIAKQWIHNEKTVMLCEAEKDLFERLSGYYSGCGDDIHLKIHEGSLKTVSKWDFVIEDDRQIPNEFMVPNLAAIEKAIKQGVRCIPGLSIFETKEIAVRIKNQ